MNIAYSGSRDTEDAKIFIYDPLNSKQNKQYIAVQKKQHWL